MADSIIIRRVGADQWQSLRALRLEALADAPLAFGSTLADEQKLPDSVWQERAATGAAGTDRATLIAASGERWLGSATGVLGWDGAGQRPAWVVGMWVHPMVRRRGVAQSLLRAVIVWAGEREADIVHLDVTESNEPAITLYERLGFRASGESAPLPHTPTVRERHMYCLVADFLNARRDTDR